ncbi:hypothetical protein FTV88_2691 [Heliorestis convoluta]|uniref:Uncharacterized protein n=2 Tax=Heliorestis convoluta TaxID=356322 RepID=A0A5Q2N939_9FIRM|nr:hypothetical protein FTV88_2691 [Heliorestis convoluta]
MIFPNKFRITEEGINRDMSKELKLRKTMVAGGIFGRKNKKRIYYIAGAIVIALVVGMLCKEVVLF